MPSQPFTVRREHTNVLKIPYAKLQPCDVEQEDARVYGLHNEDDEWKNYAVQLYKDKKSGFVGYKHLGVSERLKKNYCLGSIAFGSSIIKNDILLRNIQNGPMQPPQVEELKQVQKGGRKLTSHISGDFVFLFPCSDFNQLQAQRAVLQIKANQANSLGRAEYGVATKYEDLGTAARFGGTEWRTPHYCGLGEEPSSTGQCEAVPACRFEVDKCRFYDEIECKVDDDCASRVCVVDDGRCGEVSGDHCVKKLSDLVSIADMLHSISSGCSGSICMEALLNRLSRFCLVVNPMASNKTDQGGSSTRTVKFLYMETLGRLSGSNQRW